MTHSILVAYASRYGSTQEAAEVIAAVLGEHGFAVDLRLAKEVRALESYHAVVLGAPLFMFRWHKEVLSFLARHRKALMLRATAVFAIGPVHTPYDDSEWKAARGQLDKELARYPWLEPVDIQILGGKFDPKQLRFPLNLFAGQEPASDIRDLDAVRTWAGSLAEKFESVGP